MPADALLAQEVIVILSSQSLIIHMFIVYILNRLFFSKSKATSLRPNNEQVIKSVTEIGTNLRNGESHILIVPN